MKKDSQKRARKSKSGEPLLLAPLLPMFPFPLSSLTQRVVCSAHARIFLLLGKTKSVTTCDVDEGAKPHKAGAWTTSDTRDTKWSAQCLN